MNKNTSERGQAMVLIVLSIVGLFGFAALAIDFGQIYSARRQAQSAADAAALGAAYEAVAGTMDPLVAVDVGYDLAAINGYNNDWETNWVEINNPPIGGPYCPYCGFIGGEEYYQAKITVHLRPIFAQVFWSGAEEISVEAVAHAKTFDSATTGDAILSLDRVSGDSMLFNGTTGVTVDGGNIRSSGGITKNGASGAITLLNGGKVFYGYDGGFSGSTKPFKTAKPEKDVPYTISGMQDPTCPNENTTIDGVDYYYYPSGLTQGTLQPGIHCVNGGIGKGDYVGKGVMVVLLSGGIKQTGNDSIHFRAATDMKDANGTQWGGMALYVPYSNTSEINFGGNSEAYFQGVIYAPGAFCDIGGNPNDVGYHTAIICDTVRFHGNPDVEILYNAEELFHFPPMVELVQ